MTGDAPFPAALRLVYVADAEEAEEGRRLDRLLAGGVTCVWLRAPNATGRELYAAAGSLLLRCRRAGVALLVGDRADVALSVGADGVQLGHRSPPAASVRPWYRGWLGVSCHDAADVAAAGAAGANHVVLSPVFGVPRKGEALGLVRLASLASATPLPVVALGGIDPERVASVRAVAGVAGVAAIRGLRDAADPEAAARAMAAAPVTAS